MTDPVAWNQSKLRSVLQENIARCLGWVDADAVVCDDCTCRWWNVELFSREFQHCGERSVLGNGKAKIICGVKLMG